nr:unnamed protein product [Digitaria exilis]
MAGGGRRAWLGFAVRSRHPRLRAEKGTTRVILYLQPLQAVRWRGTIVTCWQYSIGTICFHMLGATTAKEGK